MADYSGADCLFERLRLLQLRAPDSTELARARMADDSGADCLFERLRLLQLRAPDSTELARTLTSRITARLSTHDKHVKQNTLEKLWLKSSGALQTLLAILENSREMVTSAHVAAILRETICLKQGKGKKCSANNVNRHAATHLLISYNATQTIIRTILLTHGKRESSTSTEAFMQDLIWILASLSQKDPKFPLKLRMLGCVRTVHLILKGHYTDNKVVFPLLVITKQLSKNPSTTSILIRDGIISTYERILVSLGFLPTSRLRLCLDAIDYFSKNKLCCMQIVKSGVCPLLLRIFDRWDRYDGRMRLKICAHILQTLQHLCSIKAGRRALCTKKHVQTLHRFCAQSPDEPEFDKLLARVCSVITLCLRHQTLPVSLVSPATFNLNPILKGTNTTWALSNDDDDDRLNSSDSKFINSEDDSQDTLFDNEEDLNFTEFEDLEYTSKKPVDIEKLFTKSAESFNSQSWINPNDREIEDLKRYNVFFKEFGTYNHQIRLVKSRSNSRGSIMDDIVTAKKLSACTGTSYQEISLCRSISPERSLSPCRRDTKTTINSDTKVPLTNSASSLKIYKDISRFSTFAATYSVIATRVRSVIPFVKVAYPDMMGGSALGLPEPLNKTDRSACRAKLLACVERAINPESCMNEVVYDLDLLCNSGNPHSSASFNYLSNTDEHDMFSKNPSPNRLQFESRFESGNLRKAIQIGAREYELVLMPDVNSCRRHQWFYFEVRGMQPDRPYVFNIVNCEKSDSQFNFGMKPVLYSVKEATLGRPGWVRAGSDICYYRNSYHYAHQKTSKCYLTVTFTIAFPHVGDVCYLAYHFPYTYSMMMTKIWRLCQSMPAGAYFRAEPLCRSLNNNEVPVLTITAEDNILCPIAEREIVFLTARVHPGESNASWVMDGTLECLLGNSDKAAALRGKYVFKVVPMLNVEGVINGCHRCGLTNEDLNRRWCKPSSVLHPSIYHAKGLIEYLVRVWRRPPSVYCDYHGHSRKKNVFFYGCAAGESWCTTDKVQPDQPVKYLMLPALMHRISPAFALGSCSFRVERERESTARVTVWRHLGVIRSYTMEASFCGFDRGPFKGLHLNTQHLQNVGSDFCEALNGLNDTSTTSTVDIQLAKDINGELIDISITRLVDSDKDSGHAGDSEAGSGSDSVLRSDSDEDFD